MRRPIAAALLGLLLTLAACRAMPPDGATPTPFAAPAPLTLEQAARAIERAGQSLGWTVTRQQPGVLAATIAAGAQPSAIEIIHDATQFRIVPTAPATDDAAAAGLRRILTHRIQREAARPLY
jgi:hypothetical protein